MGRRSLFLRLASRLEGPQTLGRGWRFWIGAAVVLALASAYPLVTDSYTVGNTVYFFNWVFMALGLCVIWGYGGALSFGQTAFFGIAGYAYGVITLNWGADYGLTLWATLAAVALSAIVAAVLGYFLFFGRISGVFLGIVTLAVTLVLERFMAQTAGPEWHIGSRPAQWLQRHERHAEVDDPLARRRRPARARAGFAALLFRARAAGDRLSRAPHPGEFLVRQRAGRDPRKSRARHDAWL